MNEIIVFISAYLPAATAVVGCVIACIINIKRVRDAVEKSEIKKLKDDTRALYRNLQHEIEINQELKEEIHSLKLEIRGIKPNEKVRKN